MKTHSVLQGISPTLKYWSHSFWPSSPPAKKILNLSDPFPPVYEQPHLKILEKLTHPLKCTLVQKSNTHFLKKQKILFPILKNENTFECWNMNIQLQNLKIKGDLGVF